MKDWVNSLHGHLQSARAAVRITVATTRGSAPRDAGACMLVGAQWEEGTIGGGHLELMAIAIARDMLAAPATTTVKEPSPRARLDRFPLGAALGQCCGGIVELWFERFDAADRDILDQALTLRAEGGPLVLATQLSASTNPQTHRLLRGKDLPAIDELLQAGGVRAQLQRSSGPGSVDILYERIDIKATPLWLFGAGHVGKALVKAFADLPFELTWVDGREAIFPESLPANVRAMACDDPADAVAEAPANAMYLVLTHSHDLDFEICRRILQRDDFAWAGLIGSQTKAARFMQKLRQRGASAEQLTRLTCPIGVDGIESKLPTVIAIAVAAQVLQVAEALETQSTQGTQAKIQSKN